MHLQTPNSSDLRSTPIKDEWVKPQISLMAASASQGNKGLPGFETTGKGGSVGAS